MTMSTNILCHINLTAEEATTICNAMEHAIKGGISHDYAVALQNAIDLILEKSIYKEKEK